MTETEVADGHKLTKDDWTVGKALPVQRFTIRREDLVRYAGASGDFNPIHWNDRIAQEMGLPGVIAHGMYTMALASRALVRWLGGPASLMEFGVRFAKPIVVPDNEEGIVVDVGAVVREELGEGRIRLDLTVTCDGAKVLSQARAVIKSSS